MESESVKRMKSYLRLASEPVREVTLAQMVAKLPSSFVGFTAVLHTLDTWGRLTSSTVAVLKMVQGLKCEFWSMSRFETFVPGMPIDAPAGESRLWLDDCAKAMALRRSYPHEVSGLFLERELALGEDFCLSM